MEQTVQTNPKPKMSKGKKAAILLLSIFLALIVLVIVLFFALFHSELKTLSTMEKLDEYPLYSMTYDGDYGFDDFLKTGAKNDAELIQFVTNRLLKGLPLEFNIPDLGCSTFQAHTPDGDAIFGRNFDLDYSPGLMVHTKPDNGYASLSMVNLAFLGYGKEKLPDSFQNRIIALAAPYAPLDGVNEKGVSMGVLLIPDEPTRQDTGKISINTTTAVRLVLDKAASVDEALELLQAYDLNSSANSCFHYQIADAQGNSAIVEYVDNQFSVVRVDTPYQACTNFLQTPGEKYDFGIGQDRYKILMDELTTTNGILSEPEGMELLKAASQQPHEGRDGKTNATQWSVLYNNTKGTAEVAIGLNYEHTYNFAIKP